MSKEIENIENRVRNTLGPIQFMYDCMEEISNIDSNDTSSIQSCVKLFNKDTCERVKHAINKLIILARASDMKINDKSFCIEDFIVQNNLKI